MTCNVFKMASTRVYSLCFLVCMLFLAHLATGYKRSDDAEDKDEDYDYNDDRGRSLRQLHERNYDELCDGFVATAGNNVMLSLKFFPTEINMLEAQEPVKTPFNYSPIFLTGGKPRNYHEIVLT